MFNKTHVWKPVKLDGVSLSGNPDGLICIEECTDYDLDVLISNNNRKRKPLKDELPLEPSVITKKKKKNKKIVNNTSLLPSQEGSCEFKVEKITNGEISLDYPLKDMTSWNIVPLPETIMKALVEQNFTYPTEIQMLTLPPAILGKRDILGAAETGSGKTLAFGLPILSGILKHKDKCNEALSDSDGNDSECEELEEVNDNDLGCVLSLNNVIKKNSSKYKPLYALILTPTRELAMQVKNHLTVVAKYTGIRVAVVVGGMAAVKQERILSKGPEIVIATPGRLWELIQQGNSHLSQLNDIKYLAIDETDRMLERGHFQELHNILERLNLDEQKRNNRQNFVFSATLTLIHELPKHILSKKKSGMKRKVSDVTPAQKLQKIVETLGITNPKVIDITKGIGTSETLTECRISCAIDEKDYYLYYFLQRHPGRTLIFCNSIGCVKRLTTLFTFLNCQPLALHASMQQRQRLKNLDKFKDNENSILIATDVAARGLDIPFVEHVLHYQTPRTSESYVHRSGRTARASRQGITVLLVEPSELQNYLRLCRTLEKSEDIPLFPVDENVLQSVKKRVLLAREIDKLQLLLRKTNSEAGWLEKAAKDMDIIVDEMTPKYDIRNSKNYKKSSEVKQKELTKLLAKPLFPKGFSGKYPLSSGQFDIPLVQGELNNKTALEVMKNALEISNGNRKKPKGLFKPKIKKITEFGKINLKKLNVRPNGKK